MGGYDVVEEASEETMSGGTTAEEQWQLAKRCNPRDGGLWLQPRAAGTPSSWWASPRLYVRCGGARAPGAEASQQGWARPEVAPKWMLSTFHTGSGGEALRIWSALGTVQARAIPDGEKRAAVPLAVHEEA